MELWWELSQFVHVHHVRKSLRLPSNMACTCTIISEFLMILNLNHCFKWELLTPTNHVQGSLHRFVKSSIRVRQIFSSLVSYPSQISKYNASCECH